MPMSDNGFKWRPNDNSSKTNIRYSLEAEKWVTAVSEAQRRARPRSISKDFAVIGMIIQLILSVILLIVLGVVSLIRSLIYFIESKTSRDNISESNALTRSSSKLGSERSIINYIFYNRYKELREIWKFIYYCIFIFVFELVVMLFLGQIWPEHFRLYRDSLLFIAGVSVFFAFTGLGD